MHETDKNGHTVKQKLVNIGYERTGNSALKIITDSETGEVISQVWVTENKGKPGRKVQTKTDAHFIKVYRTNLKDIVKNKKLDITEAGVLFMLLSLCGWQTPYITNPDTKKPMGCSEIATYIGYDRKHIQEILDRLNEKGIIFKTFRGKGVANHYMLNPNIAFLGKTMDDITHLESFKDCAYKPDLEIRYKPTPENNK